MVDNVLRLKSTLLHEMCHASTWIIDGVRKPPHGKSFWKWASICSANIPGMVVTTCHSYDIYKPYKFECVNCQASYGRHSKRGIDIEKKCCGVCRGKLQYVGMINSDGTVRSVLNTKVKANRIVKFVLLAMHKSIKPNGTKSHSSPK